MTAGNFDFLPQAITKVGFRPLGAGLIYALPKFQRIAALRAYAEFEHAGDFIQKLSRAYVVAISTRSADTMLMNFISNLLADTLKIDCRQCRELGVGPNAVRINLFPKLADLRTQANKLIHHLDVPGQEEVASLNVEGVFAYCHHLFEENDDALFGIFPDPAGKFPVVKCKACRALPPT